MSDETPAYIWILCVIAAIAAFGAAATWPEPKPSTYEERVDAWLHLPRWLGGEFPEQD